jgi:hypothetical protein
MRYREGMAVRMSAQGESEVRLTAGEQQRRKLSILLRRSALKTNEPFYGKNEVGP